mgnify:FL=1|tara:strand:- start:8436 stop:8867 length:432 start_codon:yes stop_codon:yes gene_type:complete
MGKNKSKTRRKIHKKIVKSITVNIDKLITLAELGLGASRPLNKEKRDWINKLAKQSEPLNPILVAPIKDTGYYVLCDGWHRVQAAKKMKDKEIDALIIPIKSGLGLAKANKILRDIDQEQNYALGVSGLINNWAFYKAMDIAT